MPRLSRTVFLLAAAAVVSLLLVLDIAYLIHGSFESFPNPEQQDKIRLATSALAIVLVLIDLAIGFILWRLPGRRGMAS
jgi:hypothetical protein